MLTTIADPAAAESWSERCLHEISAAAQQQTAYADRRATPRFAASSSALIRPEFGRPVACTLVDRSEGGARLKVLSVLGIPDTFTLSVGAEQMRARVAWRSPSEIGIAFTE